MTKSLPGRALTALRKPIRDLIQFGFRTGGLVLDQQWCRVIMDRETRRIVEGLSPDRLDVLEVSGTKWKAGPTFKSYKSVSYPEFDVCGDPLDDKFDLIIAEQVWEHLLRPSRATQNVFSMLKAGGAFLVTTPFLVRIHPTPLDCSRWTETGLKALLQDGGFSAGGITTGSWGNRKCLAANLSEWVPYNRLIHSLENEPDVPLVVWAIARKA